MDQLTINNPLVLARLKPDKFPRIGTMKREDVIIQMMEIISKAYLYKGFKFDNDNVKFLASTLYDEMMLDNHHLGMPKISLFEIGYAIKKAVMDDKEFFFSVSYLYNVIKTFCLKDGHDALIEARKISQAQNNKLQSAMQPMLDVYAGQMINNK